MVKVIVWKRKWVIKRALSMKHSKIIILFVLCVFILSACTRHEPVTTQTGVLDGEIWQTQIMYNDVIYYYFDTGFNEPLPEGYELVGSVESVDKRNVPSGSFEAVRLEVGQEVYVGEDGEAIFVKYTNGYARFEASEERDEYWRTWITERETT